MNTHGKLSISDIRTMILCAYPLSTEEYAHLYYDGDGVNKSLEEAYVWYTVAQFSGNHSEAVASVPDLCCEHGINSAVLKNVR